MLRVEVKLGQRSLADIERAIIDEVVRLADYNKTSAAKYLGITRFALDRRLKKAGDA
jgi:two-component system response regulator AtoC